MALNPETQALYDAAAGNGAKPDVAAEASPSLADHEATFRNTPRFTTPETPIIDTPDDAEPSQPPRHRAKSQKAAPDDVETIAALTKELRDAEDALGVKVEKKDGESERVYNLRRRVELAKAIAKTHTPVETPKPVAAPLVAPSTPFDEAEPTIEQFKDAADPYTAWQRALGAYDRRKEAAEHLQAQARTASDQHQAASVENKRRAYASFSGRVNEFRTTTPDYETVVAAVDRPVTYLLETAMVNDPDGPRFVYELAKNPTLHDELFILTDNRPTNRDTVASVQRLLHARMPAAPTGSAAPLTRPLAPRPPNPVRTAPSAHLPNKALGETASLADHETFYGTARRR